MRERIAALVFACLLAAGCAGKPEAVSPTFSVVPTQKAKSAPSSIAPLTTTVVPTAQKTKPPAEPAPKPSPTLACTNGLTFVSDLTVPDGAYIARGAEVDKRWQVKNSGTCNWDNRYRLVLVAGTDMGIPDSQALFPARAGSEAMIRLLLTSPDSPGSYTSAWQAQDPQGEPFGDIIYVEFQVN